MANREETSPARKPTIAEQTPWIAEPSSDGFFRVVNAESIILAQKCVREEAQLFAAAPETLDACYLALEEIQQWDEVMGGSEDPRTQTAIDALKLAIAKAEGKSTGDE